MPVPVPEHEPEHEHEHARDDREARKVIGEVVFVVADLFVAGNAPTRLQRLDPIKEQKMQTFETRAH